MKKKNSTVKYHLLKAKKDPFYNSLWLNKFSNHFVKAGKKFIIETIFFRSFIQFKQLKK
jgi:ribosomal protein S7